MGKEESYKPVLSFAAPYYFSHYYKDEPENSASETDFDKEHPEKTYKAVVEFMEDLKGRSDGMLIAFESVVPSYGLDKVLGYETICDFNDYIRNNTDLYETGGSFCRTK